MSEAKRSHHLVIVESPAKAKTISRFLDSNYKVEASYGHVRDLPQNAKEIPTAVRSEPWSRLGVKVDDGFEPLYVVPADKKKYVKQLKEALRGADSILLATDEDREGESISWHVLQLLAPKKGVDVQRIVFHEVTPEAIERALAEPRPMNENLVRAQEVRRILDRLYGYSLSPLLWKRVAPGLSAGRVQSVAVRLLVQRERERIEFRSAEYWDLKAEVAANEGRFQARLVAVGAKRLADSKSFDPKSGKLRSNRRLQLDKDAAERMARESAAAAPWVVSKLEKSPGQQRPAAPFITSTLQQEANRKLRFTSRHTMRIAQQLYEGIELGGERTGLITYMRTDSVNLAQRAIKQVRSMIEESYGSDFLPEKPVHYKTKAKRAEEAHEAIRPTDLMRRPADVKRYLDRDQYALYELIWKRTVACQMVPARFERTAVEITAEFNRQSLTFSASGRRIVFPGFLRAYVEGSDDPEAELGDQETLLPLLEMRQDIEPVQVAAEQHTTKAPLRFTEASLVKKLEEEGIGRPSTYAAIIGTVQDRGYVFRRGRELVPTFTAFCVTQLLEEQFDDLVDTRFTAKMEEDLDEVAAGKLQWNDVVAEFYHGREKKPGLVKRVEDSEVIYPSITIGADPQTGEALLVKIGRYGPYLRKGSENKESIGLAEDMPPDELTVERASELLETRSSETEPLVKDSATGRPIFLRHGRFGPYLELEPSEAEKNNKVKPKRVSLPRGMKEDEVTPEIARSLMELPKLLGKHPETSDEIMTGLGRYGPYLKHGDEFRSLESWEKACALKLEEALEILKEPKPTGRRRSAAKKVLKRFEELPGESGPVQLLEGRYGPYVTDGSVNASLPKGMDPMSISEEQVIELLAAKRAAPKKKGRRRRKARS